MSRIAKMLTDSEFQVTLNQFMQTQSDLIRVVGRGISSKDVLKIYWNNFRVRGQQLAEAIMGTKEIPTSQAKDFAKVAKMFIAAIRPPHDLEKWLYQNEKAFNWFETAAKTWKPKGEATEDTSNGSFKVGPFTVHNTIGLSQKDLEGPIQAIHDAIRFASANIPSGFGKVLYGDLYLVGKLSNKMVAWYNILEDELYLRSNAKGSLGDLHSFVHELGHRYWRKFMPKELQQQFHRRNTVCEISDMGHPELPKPGESLGVPVVGYKTPPIVQRVVGDKLYLDDKAFISIGAWLKGKRQIQCFPTMYAATNAEEHFCEVMGLKATGKLEGEHLKAFEEIFEGKGKTAGASVAINGTQYNWKRVAQTTGNRAIGSGLPEFRSWQLTGPDGNLIAQLIHSQDLPPYVKSPDKNEWKIIIRIPATPEERKQHGSEKSLTLTKRVSSEHGDLEGTPEAMALAVKAYQQFIKGREHLKVASSLTFVVYSYLTGKATLKPVPTKEIATVWAEAITRRKPWDKIYLRDNTLIWHWFVNPGGPTRWIKVKKEV